MTRVFEIFYKNPHPYFNSYVHGLTSLSNLLNNTHLSAYELENKFESKEDALWSYEQFYNMVEADVKEYNESHPKSPQKLNPLKKEIYVIESYTI
jgi:hypothetical protein